MPGVLVVAAVQEPPCGGAAPLAQFEAQLRAVQATCPQVQLVVFPELHPCGGEGAALSERAEPLHGPRSRALGKLAANLGLWLVPGSVCERGPGGQLFSTALAFSPEGKLAAHYRKVFPWRPHEPFDPGDRFVTFDLPGLGRAGFSICYDA